MQDRTVPNRPRDSATIRVTTRSGCTTMLSMRLRAFPVVLVFGLLGLPAAAQHAAAPSFAQTVASLSEPGGFFDTDNLISNESSYLQVIPELEKRGVHGGAYLGVGPDQNFSYIAAVRPSIAFIVDIRRDNLLLQLLFKALFKTSGTRVEYLSGLFGRQAPSDVASWRGAAIEKIAERVESAPRAAIPGLDAALDRTMQSFGVPLSKDDLATVHRFHQAFIDAGLSMRFQSAGRAPRIYYPTFQEMLVDKDPSGRQSNYLASDDAFQFVRGLENRDLVIPVVGDLSGPTAVASIGRFVSERNERVSAFYVSNVEFYLFREGTFAHFVTNLQRLPHSGNSVLIRSIFAGRYALTGGRPTDDSDSELQSIDDVLSGYTNGRIRMYADLIRAR